MAMGNHNEPSRPPEESLKLKAVGSFLVEVLYLPPEPHTDLFGRSTPASPVHPTRILVVDEQQDRLTIFPLNTRDKDERYLSPKYDQVEKITLEGFSVSLPSNPDEVWEILTGLPKGFLKDYEFGLGIRFDLRAILDAVEAISECTELVISKKGSTSNDEVNRIFTLAHKDFEKARKAIGRVQRNAAKASRIVQVTAAVNILRVPLGKPEKPIDIPANPLVAVLTHAIADDGHVNDEDRDSLLALVSKNAKTIAETKPEQLAKLQTEIELVTLERLIERYEQMLGQNLKEGHWQKFFNENPFLLSLASGYPIVKVQDQASVGGQKLRGSGEKIADFLMKNNLTNNTALFEIKTPKTPVVAKATYRGGIYPPSSQMSGAVNQALDQKYQFQKQIASLKEASRIHDIETYSVHCCLVIGLCPEEADQQKSLELFRRNSKDVDILTFDELLGNLKQLASLLSSGRIVDSGDSVSCGSATGAVTQEVVEPNGVTDREDGSGVAG